MNGLGKYWQSAGDGQESPPERRSFPRGATIFKQGDRADAAYILESGSVQVFQMVNGKRITLGYVEPWGMFGEMGLIDDSPRMASAYVTEDAVCTVLSMQSFTRMLAGAPDGLLLVIESLTRTLRKTGENLVDTRYQLMEREQR